MMKKVAVAVAIGIATLTLQAQSVQSAVNAAFAKYKDLKEGKNADYIPVLAKVNPDLYGIALVDVTGKVVTAGDVSTEVSIQSVSKVFTMARVIEDQGPEAIEKTIGVDATGLKFNSIVSIEIAKKLEGGPELNPLVNPGAITATSMVQGATADDVWAKIIGTYNDFAGRPLKVLQDVYRSESETNQRNQAIGMLMYAYDYIKKNPAQATDLYTRQCSVGVNAKDLAVMATAGLYDDSGKWLYHTGLPAKSGVGGGIIAVAPGKYGIAVVSPPLDGAGNSVRAQKAIRDIVRDLGINPYASRPMTASPSR